MNTRPIPKFAINVEEIQTATGRCRQTDGKLQCASPAWPVLNVEIIARYHLLPKIIFTVIFRALIIFALVPAGL